jgi:hypothetical protein
MTGRAVRFTYQYNDTQVVVPALNNQVLHLVLTLSGHPLTGWDSVYFNDELVTLDGNGAGTGKWAGYVTCKIGLGTDAGDAAFMAWGMAQAPDLWTANHKQSGRGKIWVTLTKNADLFPNGTPNVTVIVFGKAVYDPRTLLTAYSANSALCTSDYVVYSKQGLLEEIDPTILAASANVCDETVALSGGGTEKRYESHGIVDTGNEPGDNIGDLLASMAGDAIRVGGKWFIHAGYYRTPTLIFDDNDLDGPVKTSTMISARDSFNRVKGVYVSPDDLWEPTDFPVVTNATYLAEDQGEERWGDLDLALTTSASMAQRLGKITLERVRQEITYTMPCKLTAMRCRAGDVVMITNARKGWSSKPFDVADWQLAARGEGDDMRLGIDMTLRETASTVYDWNSGEETTTDPAPNTNLPDPRIVGLPGVPDIQEELYETTGSAGLKTQVTMSWGAANDAYVVEYFPRYKLFSDTEWTPLSLTSALNYTIADFAPGIYDFSVKAVNKLGASSAYAYKYSQEILGLTAIPADITGLTIQAVSSLALLRWNKHPDIDVRIGGRIHVRHSELDISIAAWETSYSVIDPVPGSETQAVAPLKPGTYLVRAEDSTGHLSAHITLVSIRDATALTYSTLSTIQEDPLFTGTKTGVVLTGAHLSISGAGLFDTIPNFDAITSLDYYGGIASSGMYAFASGLDYGVKTRVQLVTSLEVQAVNIANFLDSRVTLMDDWNDFDGTAGGAQVDCYIETRETDDDPTSGLAVWGAWRRVTTAEYYCRAHQFRLVMTSADVVYNIYVTKCRVVSQVIV